MDAQNVQSTMRLDENTGHALLMFIVCETKPIAMGSSTQSKHVYNYLDRLEQYDIFEIRRSPLVYGIHRASELGKLSVSAINHLMQS